MVRPSQRREMARTAVEGGRTNIQHACRTFEVSQTCYRYQAKASDENARIADWLVRLTTTYRDWGFGLCFLYLRNVKGLGWNHKRAQGLLHAVSHGVALVLRLDQCQREVLVVKDVVGPLGLAPSDQSAADDDAPFGEANFFADLCLNVPTRRNKRRRDELRTDVPFAQIIWTHWLPPRRYALASPLRISATVRPQCT